MKILFLTDDYPPYAWGGAGQVVFNLAKKFKELGHEVHVITTVRNRIDEGINSENGIFVYRLVSQYHERWRAWKGLYNPGVLGGVKEILRDVRPDVSHAHNIHYHLSYASLGLARRFSRSVFITLHDAMTVAYGKVWSPAKGGRSSRPQARLAPNGVAPQGGGLNIPDSNSIGYRLTFWQNLKIAKKRFNPFRNIITKRYLNQADKIFSVSDALKDFLEMNGLSNIETVYNGLDVPAGIPAAADENFLRRFGLSKKKVLFLGGRISHAKGVYAAINAIAEIKNKIPDAVLFLAGVPDDEKKKIEAYAIQLGVKDLIRIAGWLSKEEMPNAYVASNIVLVPSLYLDPFPNANLEAAFYKKPVVATCFGGSKEFVIDGKTGYVVNPYDKTALASKIIDLLSDKNKAENFGLAAFERLKNDFSLSRQAEELLRYYKY